MKESRKYRSLGHCRFCNEEVFGTHHNKLQTHQRFCLCNPNRQKNIESRKRGSLNRAKVVSWKQQQKSLENEATRKLRSFKCVKCKSVFTLNLTNREYQKILDNPKTHNFRRHCSQSCANSHIITEDQKKKQSNTLKKTYSVKKKHKSYLCKNCGKTYTSVNSNIRNFCSEECRKEYRQKPHTISEETRKKLSEAGKKAAANIKILRRSKNEILFCQLCEQKFKHVVLQLDNRKFLDCGIDWRDQRRAHNPYNIRADLIPATKRLIQQLYAIHC